MTDLINQKNPINKLSPYEHNMSMDAVINHDFSLLENIYNKDKDLLPFYYDRTGYHSLISLIMETDVRHLCKNFFIKIINDAKNIPIEPPEIPGELQSGVCHCVCKYGDVDVAKLLFHRNDIIINRFNKEHNLGPVNLIDRKGKCVAEIILLAIENGLDINKRYDLNSPTILESFIEAISKNYDAIELLIKYGADINALHSRRTDRKGKPLTLLESVKNKYDRKMKKIFENAENY
mgnify:CR=1 FL=1